MNQVIRDIELCKLTGEDLDTKTKDILEILNNLFDKIVFNTHEDYYMQLFMCIDDNIMLILDYNVGVLFCTYDIFGIPYKIHPYDNTRDIVIYAVIEQLKKRFNRLELPVDPSREYQMNLLTRIDSLIVSVRLDQKLRYIRSDDELSTWLNYIS